MRRAVQRADLESPIFAHFHTIPALYLLYPCSWTLTAFAEILYFVHCYKQSMALFKEPQAA